MDIIKINDKYHIEKGPYSWILVFSEMRERKNKKTGDVEDFLFKDMWYFPCMKRLLKKALDLDLKESNSLAEISERIEALDSKIEELKDTIFNKRLSNK